MLLIDDDEPTNFYHQRVVEKSGCAEQCQAVNSGAEALAFLKSAKDGMYPQPDLVFLDINMPAMNGWEFLEEYRKLKTEQQAQVVVVMLTTSLNPDDMHSAKVDEDISNFIHKPLDQGKLQEVLENYFEGRF